MLKQFLAKHFGLVRLNAAEKKALLKYYNDQVTCSSRLDTMGEDGKKILNNIIKECCSRLTALGISFTYNKRTGIK
jgi:hypothetical protein